jgi:hypothetical protein
MIIFVWGVQFRLEGVNPQWGPRKITAPSYASVAPSLVPSSMERVKGRSTEVALPIALQQSPSLPAFKRGIKNVDLSQFLKSN